MVACRMPYLPLPAEDHQLKNDPRSLKYFHMPARWGLQQTTLAPGSDKTRARDPPSDKPPKIKKYGPTTGPVLLRPGEPGTSQNTFYFK